MRQEGGAWLGRGDAKALHPSAWMATGAWTRWSNPTAQT